MEHYNNEGKLNDHQIFDKLVFNKIKSLLGGRVNILFADNDCLYDNIINYFKNRFISIKNKACFGLIFKAESDGADFIA